MDQQDEEANNLIEDKIDTFVKELNGFIKYLSQDEKKRLSNALRGIATDLEADEGATQVISSDGHGDDDNTYSYGGRRSRRRKRKTKCGRRGKSHRRGKK